LSKHALEILHHIIIGKPDHSESFPAKPFGAVSVVVNLIRMRVAVDLDNQTILGA
jgi:hypothetical protein